MKDSILKALNYFNLMSAIYLTASLIYYYPVQKIGFFLFFGSFVIEIFLERKWTNIQFDKKSAYYFGMLLFFLLAIFYLPFENSSKYSNLLIDKRLALLGFSIVGILGLNKTFKLNYFLNTFIISSIVAICYLIFIRIGLSEFLSNPLRFEVFTAERMKYVNSHMMFNFYMNVSLISIWFLLTRTWKRTIWWKRYLYIAAMTIIFSILSVSEGRSGFLMGILLMLSFIFFEIWKRRKMLGLIIGFMVPFLLIGIVSNHKRMSEKELEGEPRIFLWKSALSVIKEKPIVGFGISDAQEKFDVARTKFQTEEYRLNWITQKHLDSHNQYLQTTMEFGIVGLLMLLFLYFYPIFIAENNKRFFSILLLFLCAYQSLFDMFLTGPFSTIFGFIIILILSVENNVVRTTTTK